MTRSTGLFARGWRSVRDTATRDGPLGVHYVDLSTASLPTKARIDFTFYWPLVARWERTDFAVAVE